MILGYGLTGDYRAIFCFNVLNTRANLPPRAVLLLALQSGLRKLESVDL